MATLADTPPDHTGVAMRIRTRVLGLVAALAVGASLTAVNSAAMNNADGAKVPDTSGAISADAPSPRLLAVQGELVALAHAIQALADPKDDGSVETVAPSLRGLARLTIDPEASSMDMYWAGPVPSAVTSLVAKSPDLQVRFHTVRLSLAQLAAGTERLSAEAAANGEFRGAISIVRVVPRGDEGLLRVYAAPIAGVTSTDAQEMLEEVAGVPIEIHLAPLK